MNLNNVTKKAAIGIAALATGAYALATDPVVLALLPAPWGMLLSKFVIGAGAGSVLYNMQPKQDAPKDGGIRG